MYILETYPLTQPIKMALSNVEVVICFWFLLCYIERIVTSNPKLRAQVAFGRDGLVDIITFLPPFLAQLNLINSFGAPEQFNILRLVR